MQLGGRSDTIYQKIQNLVFEQFDTKSWQDLDDPEEWTTWLYRGNVSVKEYRQTCTSTYTIGVYLACRQTCLSQRKTLEQANESCLASVRILRAQDCAERPGDAMSAPEVRELNSLVSKRKMSNPVATSRPVCVEKVMVVTTVDASFCGRKKRAQSRRILENDHDSQ